MHDPRSSTVIPAKIPDVPEARIYRSYNIESDETREHDTKGRSPEMPQHQVHVGRTQYEEGNHPQRGRQSIQPRPLDKQYGLVAFAVESFHHLHVPSDHEGFEQELEERFEIDHAPSIYRVGSASNFFGYP